MDAHLVQKDLGYVELGLDGGFSLGVVRSVELFVFFPFYLGETGDGNGIPSTDHVS